MVKKGGNFRERMKEERDWRDGCVSEAEALVTRSSNKTVGKHIDPKNPVVVFCIGQTHSTLSLSLHYFSFL